jgi:uncharacterized FAD-dependent dehydrogenase
MCPGGYVVHAASENNTICTNGMSYYHRSGKNANSALLVSVTPQDYPSDHPLAGMEFQRKIEQYAYRKVDGYRLPVQTVGHFLNKTKTNELSLVVPSCRCPYVMEDLRLLLPSFIIESLQMALPLFDKKIKGFSGDQNILVGVETRSSSPIRIERDNHYCSVSLKGLYPCGEGAGFAGGIISAAVDGIKAVESVLKNVYNIGR